MAHSEPVMERPLSDVSRFLDAKGRLVQNTEQNSR